MLLKLCKELLFPGEDILAQTFYKQSAIVLPSAAFSPNDYIVFASGKNDVSQLFKGDIDVVEDHAVPHIRNGHIVKIRYLTILPK